MCSDLEPGALLLILDGIFTQWDVLVEKHKLQKIKTIGDCFMAAGGVPDRTVDHAERYEKKGDGGVKKKEKKEKRKNRSTLVSLPFFLICNKGLSILQWI